MERYIFLTQGGNSFLKRYQEKDRQANRHAEIELRLGLAFILYGKAMYKENLYFSYMGVYETKTIFEICINK